MEAEEEEEMEQEEVTMETEASVAKAEKKKRKKALAKEKEEAELAEKTSLAVETAQSEYLYCFHVCSSDTFAEKFTANSPETAFETLRGMVSDKTLDAIKVGAA